MTCATLSDQLDVAERLRVYKGEEATYAVLTHNDQRHIERFWTVHIWLNYLADIMNEVSKKHTGSTPESAKRVPGTGSAGT